MQKGVWEEKAAARNAGRNAENVEATVRDSHCHKVKLNLMHIQFFFFSSHGHAEP